MQSISIKLTQSPKKKPTSQSMLGFGRVFTDHMFIMDYNTNKGWYDPRIVPYGNIKLDPASMCLHYGQETFEGLKAYRSREGKILLFRPIKNMQRMNLSNDRLCIPRINDEFCLEAIKKLVYIDRDWVPKGEGTSLYIRPFIIATDPFLGVHPANNLKFIVICSPVGAYYTQGINPIKIYVETKYVRAVKGGIGYAKTAGNYAASLKAQSEAEKKDYTQVLWLDGVYRKYIEEVGTMNVFFVIDDKIVTPELNGSILPGITRLSVIELLKSWGYNVLERKISIDELYDCYVSNRLVESFGTGTAAVVSPIGELRWEEKIIKINDGKTGKLANKIYNALTDIQFGKVNDNMNWTVSI